ncbi:MAG: hypothetical protein RL468_2729 [Pseudomonadota bacterium]
MRVDFRTVYVCALIALNLLGITGCDKRPVGSGQVLARVNGEEISVHQVNFALQYSRQRNNPKDASNAVLETMISRQLAVQEAMSMGLDRNPDVMMRLQEARLETLASAYAAEISRKLPPMKDEAVASFYREHPALFAQRRIYRLREITVPVENESYKNIKEELAKSPPSSKTLSWMRQQPGKWTDQTVVRPSNDLPVEIADRLLPLDAGKWLVFESPAGLLLYEVQSFEANPMSWTTAAPLIRENLTRQEEKELLSKTMAQLREKAKIERQTKSP